MDFLFSLLGVSFFSFIADRSLRAKPYKGPITDHFDGKVFYNYENIRRKHPAEVQNGFPEFVRWIVEHFNHKTHWKREPLARTTKPAARVNGDELVATFVGHSTVLIQTEGLNIITDPVWSNRASPFSFVGPKRFRQNGIEMNDLPPIDAVLLSHNHYDHMDIATLKELAMRWNPKIFVPLGNKNFLLSHGFINVEEMDWWDKKNLEELHIACVPAHHFSSRGFSDRNKTLWSGFVLETSHGDIYFAGDTGDGEFIEKIRDKYSDGFRLALLPIGAFKPEWFMGPIHMSPDQAFMMHHDIRAKTSVGIHFGTFNLADDDEDEAPNRIRELREASPSPKPNFIILKNGEHISVEI